MTEELPKVVLSTGEKILHRTIGTDMEAEIESDMWTQSGPVSGSMIVNSWQIYPGVWLILTRTEAGHYLISRSSDGMKSFSVVHDHASEVLGLFYVDDGHVLICCADGWMVTRNSGDVWETIAWESYPLSRSVAIIGIREGLWALVAYGTDRKIYYCEYSASEAGEWEEVYDASDLTARWHPAIAGCPVGILAGAGDRLLRSRELGRRSTWEEIQALPGPIRSIAISSQSNTPTFLIVVEKSTDTDTVYWTYDLGDSLVPDLNRVGAVAAVQSVIPTGMNVPQTMFAVIGKREASGRQTCKIITD